MLNPRQQQFQRQLQQLQQLQQMKGFPNLKLFQFKDMKFPLQNPNQKGVKFMPEEDDLSDDEYDDDDFDDLNDELDDEMYESLLNKIKAGGGDAPMMGNGAAHIMLNGMVNGNHAQPMNNGFQKMGGHPGMGGANVGPTNMPMGMQMG